MSADRIRGVLSAGDRAYIAKKAKHIALRIIDCDKANQRMLTRGDCALVRTALIAIVESEFVFQKVQSEESVRRREYLMEWHCDTLLGFLEYLVKTRWVFAWTGITCRAPRTLPKSVDMILRRHTIFYERLVDDGASDGQMIEALLELVRLELIYFAHVSK